MPKTTTANEYFVVDGVTDRPTTHPEDRMTHSLSVETSARTYVGS